MGIVNRIQNAWTRRQSFNLDTLILVGSSGQQITVNANPLETDDIVTYLPEGGAVIALLGAYNSVSQALDNVELTISFNTLGALQYGNAISLAASQFTILKRGLYELTAQFLLTQNVNSNITQIWIRRNGSAAANSGSEFSAKTGGEVSGLTTFAAGILEVGDVIDLQALCTNNNGSTLTFIPAAGNVPAILGARVFFRGVQIID